jgi:ribosome-associated protein
MRTRAMPRKRPKRQKTSRELAIEIARSARDNNCYDIIILDLREVSPVTDYFVICTGTSDRQMRTVAQGAAERGESIGQKVWRTAGIESADWIVLDFVDVVCHVFDQQHREYYDLELIWGAVPRVNWDSEESSNGASE